MSDFDKGIIIPISKYTRADIPANNVLSGALDKLESVLVIGVMKDDSGYYFASSLSSGGECLWLLEQYKKAILELGGRE